MLLRVLVIVSLLSSLIPPGLLAGEQYSVKEKMNSILEARGGLVLDEVDDLGTIKIGLGENDHEYTMWFKSHFVRLENDPSKNLKLLELRSDMQPTGYFYIGDDEFSDLVRGIGRLVVLKKKWQDEDKRNNRAEYRTKDNISFAIVIWPLPSDHKDIVFSVPGGSARMGPDNLSAFQSMVEKAAATLKAKK